MAVVIDRIMALLKWPVALLSVLALPSLIPLLWSVSQGLVDHLYFVVGLGLYFFLWRFFFSSRHMGSWFPTLMHELTHGLFAVLTLHQIRSLNATWSEGGEITISGGPGNWLITIAPYFVPLTTLSAIVILGYAEVDHEIRRAVLGFVIGFEMVCMRRQLHAQQPDLHKVGWVFVWMFLPGAWLWEIGMMLTALNGDSIWAFTQTMLSNEWQWTRDIAVQLWEWMNDSVNS